MKPRVWYVRMRRNIQFRIREKFMTSKNFAMYLCPKDFVAASLQSVCGKPEVSSGTQAAGVCGLSKVLKLRFDLQMSTSDADGALAKLYKLLFRGDLLKTKPPELSENVGEISQFSKMMPPSCQL